MSESNGVSFNEEPSLVRHQVHPVKRSGFSPIQIVMNLGIAKTEQGANTTLASFAVVMIIAAAGTYLWSTVPKGHVSEAEVNAQLHAMHANGY